MSNFLKICKRRLYWERLRYAVFARTRSTGLWKLLSGMLTIGCAAATLFPNLNELVPFGSIVCMTMALIFITSFVVMVFRDWLKLTIFIPPDKKQAGDYGMKVCLNLHDILQPVEIEKDEKRDLVLLYNSNNIIGGIRNYLLSQFLCKYFPDKSGQTMDPSGCAMFNFELFRSCLEDKESGVYSADDDWRDGAASDELKNKVLASLKDLRDAGSKETEVQNSFKQALAEPVLGWGKGIVIALKLPENPDYQYAYLICATCYKGNYDAYSDLPELTNCIRGVWKVAALKHLHQLPDYRISLPILGKGYAQSSEAAFCILWEIVSSYRRATRDSKHGRFGISIYAPREILNLHALPLSDLLFLLRFALLG